MSSYISTYILYIVRINNGYYLKDMVFERHNKYNTRITNESSKAYFQWGPFKSKWKIALIVITAQLYIIFINIVFLDKLF